jgi:hypothetical protein
MPNFGKTSFAYQAALKTAVLRGRNLKTARAGHNITGFGSSSINRKGNKVL